MSDRVRAFYVNATAWDFAKDVQPYLEKMRKIQADEFDARLSEARAEAWDYGYSAGVVDEATECTDHLNCARNPYREEPE